MVDGTIYARWGWWLAGDPDDADGGLIAFDLPADGRGRMPGWSGSLSAEEIEAVVEYERTVLSRGGG